MTYSNKFASCVISNNKILREINETVSLPFGSEYKIRLKNLNSVKALVQIKIDGEDVLSANKIIVEPNSSVDLDGFMRTNGQISHRFKFIEKTEQISNYRGDRVDDGIIEIRFKFEKPQNYVSLPYVPTIEPWFPFPPKRPYWNSNIPVSGSSTHDHIKCSHNDIINSIKSCAENYSQFSYDSSDHLPIQDSGITVRGGKSNQNFVSGNISDLETSETVICIKLRGKVEKRRIVAPVTIHGPITCSTCGQKHKSNKRFCSNCGTALFN